MGGRVLVTVRDTPPVVGGNPGAAGREAGRLIGCCCCVHQDRQGRVGACSAVQNRRSTSCWVSEWTPWPRAVRSVR